MTYTIDVEARLVRMSGSATLTDAEMLECISALLVDPLLEPDMDTLSDMRDIEIGFTREGVERMVAVMESRRDSRAASKAAIVVSTDVAFGMGRMVELRSEGQTEPRFRIFRDMRVACEWLGIA
jgi:hypothetical protein